MTTVFPAEEPADVITAERRERRHEEISNWLSHFAGALRCDGVDVSVADGAADALNVAYWELLQESVRPRVVRHDGTHGHIDRHKIASLFELLIVHEQPLLHGDAAIAADLNARLAFFVAINIIAAWNGITADDLYVSESFDREHRTWLNQLSRYREGWPIFSNAATWYLVELVYLERIART
jgi:hypothetical protein